MINDDKEDRIFQGIRKKSLAQALSESNDNYAELPNYSLKVEVNNLGKKVGNEYRELYEKLDHADDVSRDAMRFYRIAERGNYLWWTIGFAAGAINENELTREYANIFEAGYSRSKGYAFYDSFLAENATAELINASGKLPSMLLEGMALYWFCEADNLCSQGKILESLDYISDAYGAILQAFSLSIWDVATGYAGEEKRSNAHEYAKKRHVKTYALRQQVIDYWREHIPLEISNEKAGKWLHDSFPKLSVRKLSEYVSQAKKEVSEIPPTSKA